MRQYDVNITRGREADEEFTAWYTRDFARVRATLALTIHDSGLAEEAASEAFARALLHWPTVRQARNPTGWVYRVALNEVSSTLRRRRVERRYLARQREGYVPPPPEPDPALWDAVRQLPVRQRTAVALRYVDDLSDDEIAQIMGITRGTVAATLHKARKRLAELLPQHAPQISEEPRS